MSTDHFPANVSAVPAIQRIVGPCVLLACNGKKPRRKAWQKLKLFDMTSEYLASLENANIGISLGAPSEGLISIDFDDDAALSAFLAHNPKLEGSLRSRGQRGGNIWLRILGDLPSSTRLVDNSKQPVGEFRSTGNQTIIHGIHPTTRQPYRIVREAPPATVSASELHWPPNVKPQKWPSLVCDRERIETKGRQTTQRNTEDSTEDLSALYHTPVITAAIAALDAEQCFEQAVGKSVATLYDRLVERRYPAKAHARNKFITVAVPFLFRALSRARVLAFSMQYFARNRALFRDSAEAHRAETTAMLNSVAASYTPSLMPDERALYVRLDPPLQDVFRICRDFAANTSNEHYPPPLFPASCKHIADRIDVRCEQGRRLLNKLVRLGIIAIHVNGSAHTKGRLGEATTYRWLLQLPP